MSDYKPTEHDGLRKDGQPDQRVQQTEFAHGKVDPSEAGRKGGLSSGGGGSGSGSDGSEGLQKDGQLDERAQGTGFAHGKVDPREAGRKGGLSSGSGGGGDSNSEGSENPQGAAHLGGEGLRKDGQPDQRLKQNQ